MEAVSVPTDQIWMVVVGFVVAFVLAFGIGANDVANSFGTSVGSGVLTLRQACVLATIFEMLGSIFLGAKVSNTIRKGIIDIEPYENQTSLLMIGNVAALSGSCCWMLVATLLRLPVSATHSIVGATVGFALVAHGAYGINWKNFGFIIASWFISPVCSGGVSVLIFFVCNYFILKKEEPLEPGLRFLPIFYASTLVVNLFSVFYDGPEMFGFDRIPLWGTFIISFGTGIICAIVVRYLVVPWQRNRITEQCRLQREAETESGRKAFFSVGGNSEVNLALDVRSKSAEDFREINEKMPLRTISQPNDSSVFKRNYSHDQHSNPSSPLPVDVLHEKISHLVVPETKRPTEHPHKKDDAASLVNNEQNIGTSTPAKSPTVEDFNKMTTEANGFTVPEEPQESVVSVATVSPEVSSHKSFTRQLSHLEESRTAIKDGPEVVRLFSFLQILTAIFGSFAHGGNDVSNAIGPLIGLWLTATTGIVLTEVQTPIWILFYGGLGISIGLWVWGRRVIKTVGEDLTKITPSSGFCIEIGAALTVLVASNCSIPISTTHCKVGSVVFVGRFRSKENVDWSIFRNIIFAWAVTLPVSGGISAALMALLRLAV